MREGQRDNPSASPALLGRPLDDDEIFSLTERIPKYLFKSQTTSLMATVITRNNTSSHTAEAQVKDTE